MVEGDGTFERGSLPFPKDAGIPFEQLAVNESLAPLAADRFRGCRAGHLRATKRISTRSRSPRRRWSRRGSKLAGSRKLLTSAFITNFLYRGH
jgi:hypothetical protein